MRDDKCSDDGQGRADGDDEFPVHIAHEHHRDIDNILFRFRFGRYLIVIIIIIFPVVVPARKTYKILLPPPARRRDSRLAVFRSEGTTALGGPVTLRERGFWKVRAAFRFVYAAAPPPRGRRRGVLRAGKKKNNVRRKKKKIP